MRKKRERRRGEREGRWVVVGVCVCVVRGEGVSGLANKGREAL